MIRKISYIFFIALLPLALPAQKPVISPHPLRVVDTLTPLEKTTRNPVLLQSELDSMIRLYNVQNPPVTPVQNDAGTNQEITQSSGNRLETVLLLLLAGGLALSLYFSIRQQKQLKKLAGNMYPAPASNIEKRIQEMQAEMHKLTRENEGLNRVIREYNGIQHEFDSLRHGMQKAYKIKQYPGHQEEASEIEKMQAVLDTENAVARFSYDKMLKPLLALIDKNKNNPSAMTTADSDKILELLLSLSFLHIEHLYLQVGELSVGGKMVDRMDALKKGKSPDPGWMKKLNTETGNRALVVRLALNRAKIRPQSYPVFDETNLNTPV